MKPVLAFLVLAACSRADGPVTRSSGVLVVAVPATAPQHVPDAGPPPVGPRRVSTPDYQGWIIEGDWQPTDDDIAELERQLPELVRRDPALGGAIADQLPRYTRQYWPLARQGRGVSVILRRDAPADWGRHPSSIHGGGKGVLQGHYDADQRRWDAIRSNSGR
jgi:hypothetical protein